MSHSTKKLGLMFSIGAWIIAFVLLALAFSKILDYQNNPNQSLSTLRTVDSEEVVLLRNRRGHYVFDGRINGREVTFLVDTGATTTAIPGRMRDALGLEAGPAISVSTANGVTRAYLTRLDSLSIGDIEMRDVKATLVDNMGVDEILLGMNVLKHFELTQRGDELIIRRYR
jgi:aspartyl protease family protein